MRHLFLGITLLGLLASGAPAGSIPAQSSPTGANRYWLAYTDLPTPNIGSTEEASVAVDVEGNAHIIHAVDSSDRIYYFNTRFQGAGANGFTTPLLLVDSAAQESVAEPDIWVDPAGTVHGVWIHNFPPVPGEFVGSQGVLEYRAMDTNGLGVTKQLVNKISFIRYEDPQVVVSALGEVHITATQISDVTGDRLGFHFVLRPTESDFESVIPPFERAPRIATRGNKLVAVWEELVQGDWNISWAQATLVAGQLPAWSSINSVTAGIGGQTRNPDVDIDSSGDPHFSWRSQLIGVNQILHKKWNGPTSTVSELPGPGTPSQSFDDNSRVRISGDKVHVFYAGFSHASRTIGTTAWDREQPLNAPNATDNITRAPDEVAVGGGRNFHIVNNEFYTRSDIINLPDGVSWEPAFPGGSVNLVPLNGSPQYRLNLFSTSGVGPSTSLGITYNSKEKATTLLGPGWTIDFMMRIIVNGDESITLVFPNGLSIPLSLDPDIGYVPSVGGFGFVAQIAQIANGWRMVMRGGTEYEFSTSGRLARVIEPTGNFLEVFYGTQGFPVQIVDMQGNGGVGRVTQIHYRLNPGDPLEQRIRAITDPGGSRYEFNYNSIFLSEVVFASDPETPTYGFEYNLANEVSRVIPPRGFVANPQYGYSVFYDGSGRVEHIEDPADLYLLDTDGDLVDPEVRTAKKFFLYNQATGFGGAGLHTECVDRRGVSTVHVFDAAQNFAVTEVWDQAALDDINNPTPSIHPVRRTFDAFGNVLTHQNRWDFTTRYTYVPKTIFDDAAWLTTLVETVERPTPDGGGTGFELVEEFTYTADELGNVKIHTTYATPTDGTAPVARVTTHDYNGFSQRISTTFPNITRPDGVNQTQVTIRSEYNGPRRQVSLSWDEEDRWTSLSSYHPIHGLPESSLREGGTQPYETQFNEMGLATMTRAPQGGSGNDLPGITVNTYDGLWRLVSYLDPAGKTTTHSFDRDSNLISIQPPAGGATTTSFGKRGFVLSITTPDGAITQAVDAMGNVHRSASLRGHDTNRDFDFLGRVVETRAPGASTLLAPDGGGPTMVTQWTYDTLNAGIYSDTVTRLGDTLDDRTTKTEFDNRRRPTRGTAPDNDTITELFYDEQDQIVGIQVTYQGFLQAAALTFRDNRDRIHQVRIQDAPFVQGATLPPGAAESNTYYVLNKFGVLVKMVDPLGEPLIPGENKHKRSFILDSRHRVFQEVDGLGQVVIQNIWGDDDLLVEMQVPDPATKGAELVTWANYTYTTRKELKSIKNRSGFGLDYTYNDIKGQVDTIVDSKLRETKTTYYADTQRVDEVIVAKGTPNERRTKNVWVEALLTEIHVWNPVSNAYNAVYHHFYDEADRPERFEFPTVAVGIQPAPERYTFNAFSEADVIFLGGRILTHGYDLRGLRTSTTWSGTHTAQHTMTYNGIQKLSSISDGSLKKVLTYDLWLGTLEDETFQVWDSQANDYLTWQMQTHGYDVATNYISLADSESTPTETNLHEWIHDEDNRVKEIKYKGVVVYSIDYTVGWLVDKTRCFDSAGVLIAQTTHSYDGRGRKIRQQTVNSVDVVVADFEWEYDKLDLVTAIKVHHLGVEAALVYNERDELIQEVWSGNNSGQDPPPYTNSLGGAAAGAESDTTADVSAAPNTSLGVGPINMTYLYDPIGNRIKMDDSVVETTYTYNSACQLTGESHERISDFVIVKSVSHTYDEWGNEEARVTTPDVGGAITENYGYNHLNLMSTYIKSSLVAGWQIDFWPTEERYAKINLDNSADDEFYVTRFGDVVTEYSDANTLKNSYVQGTGVDSKSLRIDGAGTRRHYLGDSVGTISVTLNDTGVTEEISLTDVWGVQLSGGTPSERYGYAQREHDQDSGFVHMRARMYDPNLGRFTQIDPVLVNRYTEHYAYVYNNPTANVDPFGRQAHQKRPTADEILNATDPAMKMIDDITKRSVTPGVKAPKSGGGILDFIMDTVVGLWPWGGGPTPVTTNQRELVIGGYLNELKETPNNIERTALEVTRDPVGFAEQQAEFILNPDEVNAAAKHAMKGFLNPNLDEAGGHGAKILKAAAGSRALKRGGKKAKPKSAGVHGHHSFPQYLGGAQKQTLTKIPRRLHEKLHGDLDRWEGGKFLRKTSGKVIREQYTPRQIEMSLRRFYRQFEGGAYLDAFETALRETRKLAGD